MAKFTYQDRASTAWEPGKNAKPKTVSATPLTREEMDDYMAGKALTKTALANLQSGDGYYENGKWVYSPQGSSTGSSVVRLPALLPGTGATFTPTVSTTHGNFTRCYESHPAMPLADGFVVYGGSCHSPVVTDADIYIALDGGFHHTARHWPWHSNHVQEIEFPIQDGNIPKSEVAFVQLIAWLTDQIRAGKKVHIGCIGGHGRTGMVLTALYSSFNPEAKDIIQYVRANYCKKAVETGTQIAFLVALTGCSTVEGSKAWDKPSTGQYGGKKGKKKGKKGHNADQEELDYYAALAAKNGLPQGTDLITPMSSPTCIWGPNAAYSK